MKYMWEMDSDLKYDLASRKDYKKDDINKRISVVKCVWCLAVFVWRG